MMKTLRLFGLLNRLRSAPAPISAEALAHALDVSPRTIYRDMATLLAMGAPVRGESGLGYQLEKGYFLPPLRFDPDELETIMLGLRLVVAKGDDVMAAAAGRVSGKISAVMGAEAGEAYKELPLRAVTRPTDEAERANRHLPRLRQAVRDRQVLDISYRDLRNQRSRRIVRPLGLTLFDTAWLLTAWCEARNDFRNFRLDRIAEAIPTGARFRHEAGRRFQDYLKTL